MPWSSPRLDLKTIWKPDRVFWSAVGHLFVSGDLGAYLSSRRTLIIRGMSTGMYMLVASLRILLLRNIYLVMCSYCFRINNDLDPI